MLGVITALERRVGFLVDEDDTRRFFHRRDMVGPLRPTVGLVVEFEAATDPKGRPQAVQVRPIPQAPFTAPGDRGGGRRAARDAWRVAAASMTLDARARNARRAPRWKPRCPSPHHTTPNRNRLRRRGPWRPFVSRRQAR
jgi:hypothetical protein